MLTANVTVPGITSVNEVCYDKMAVAYVRPCLVSLVGMSVSLTHHKTGGTPAKLESDICAVAKEKNINNIYKQGM